MTDQRKGKTMTAFDGFGSGLVAFFDQLSANNSREWFKRHKDEYDNEIAGPLQSLGEALEPEFGAIKIYRPYRDLRFSADKRPIQEHASLSASDARGFGYYLQVSADGLVVAGGLYQPDRDRLNRFRTMLDSKPAATKVKRQLTAAQRHDLKLSDAGKLKSAPRGLQQGPPGDRPAALHATGPDQDLRTGALDRTGDLLRPRPRRVAPRQDLDQLPRTSRHLRMGALAGDRFEEVDIPCAHALGEWLDRHYRQTGRCLDRDVQTGRPR